MMFFRYSCVLLLSVGFSYCGFGQESNVLGFKLKKEPFMDYSGQGIFGRDFVRFDTTEFTFTRNLAHSNTRKEIHMALKVCINPLGEVLECSAIKRASRKAPKEFIKKQCENILNSTYESDEQAQIRECGIFQIILNSEH